jgi:putative ABC transport system permease protein
VNSIEKLGTNLLSVWKKRLTVEERRLFSGRNTQLRYKDVLAIRQRFPDLGVVPIAEFDGQLKAGDRDHSGRMTGTSPEYPDIRNFHVSTGRFFLPLPILREWRRTLILGKTVAEVLFGSQSPIEEEVKIATSGLPSSESWNPKGEVYGKDLDQNDVYPCHDSASVFHR